jgi:hypothetical protein
VHAQLHIVKLDVVFVVGRRQQDASAEFARHRVLRKHILRNVQRHYVVLLDDLKDLLQSRIVLVLRDESQLRCDFASQVDMDPLSFVHVHELAHCFSPILKLLPLFFNKGLTKQNASFA